MITPHTPGPTPWRTSLLRTLGLLALATATTSTIAQDHAAPKSKPLEFAVVSIRPNKTGGPQLFGSTTPDGYAMHNMFLAAPILTAYVPQSGGASAYADDQVIGLPAWAYSDDDHYDITAKIDDADLADWHDPAKQPAMLRAMLQAMLADRLKLAVHRSVKHGPVLALVIGKNGPAFKPSDPSAPHPGAYPFPGGGSISLQSRDGETITRIFGITMSQLALSLNAGRPVQDRTGLTGTYDFTLHMPTPSPPPPGPQHQQDTPPDPEISSSAKAEQLGLKLVPTKGQIETLVIDHIERPSEN